MEFRTLENVFRTLANVFRAPANVFRTLTNVFRTLTNVFRAPANVFRTLTNVFRTLANVFGNIHTCCRTSSVQVKCLQIAGRGALMPPTPMLSCNRTCLDCHKCQLPIKTRIWKMNRICLMYRAIEGWHHAWSEMAFIQRSHQCTFHNYQTNVYTIWTVYFTLSFKMCDD